MMKRLIPLCLTLCCLLGCASTAALPSPTTSAAPQQTASPDLTAAFDSTAAPESELAVTSAKITAAYTSSPVAEPDADISGGYTPAVDLMLWTDRAITDFRIVSLGFDAYGCHSEDKTLHPVGALNEADDAFILRMVFWGDIPSTGLAYTDVDGSDKLYSIGMSGKDGSLVLAEVLPPPKVMLSVRDLTPTGMTLVALAREMQIYGEGFWLEVLQDGVWSRCTAIVDQVMVPAIGIELPADVEREIKVGWSNIFGSLTPGHYRITKDFSGEQYTAEFTIE